MKVYLLTYVLHNRMVATDMGTAGFKLLADNGIDVGVKPLSVEESAQGIKSVVGRQKNAFNSGPDLFETD